MAGLIWLADPTFLPLKYGQTPSIYGMSKILDRIWLWFVDWVESIDAIPKDEVDVLIALDIQIRKEHRWAEFARKYDNNHPMSLD